MPVLKLNLNSKYKSNPVQFSLNGVITKFEYRIITKAFEKKHLITLVLEPALQILALSFSKFTETRFRRSSSLRAAMVCRNFDITFTLSIKFVKLLDMSKVILVN